jgi:hypothetical protein
MTRWYGRPPCVSLFSGKLRFVASFTRRRAVLLSSPSRRATCQTVTSSSPSSRIARTVSTVLRVGAERRPLRPPTPSCPPAPGRRCSLPMLPRCTLRIAPAGGLVQIYPKKYPSRNLSSSWGRRSTRPKKASGTYRWAVRPRGARSSCTNTRRDAGGRADAQPALPHSPDLSGG